MCGVENRWIYKRTNLKRPQKHHPDPLHPCPYKLHTLSESEVERPLIRAHARSARSVFSDLFRKSSNAASYLWSDVAEISLPGVIVTPFADALSKSSAQPRSVGVVAGSKVIAISRSSGTQTRPVFGWMHHGDLSK